jgi:predicted acetyltransferase
MPWAAVVAAVQARVRPYAYPATMPLVLRKLNTHDEEAFLRALQLTVATDPNFVRSYHSDLSFAGYLYILDEAERGRGLAEGHVPSTLLFGFVGKEIVGRLMLRHSLNEFFSRVGGHIGFVVVPEHRRRGYATEMLRQGLDHARSIGLTKVLVTCDEGNIASRRTIEKCGGEYEDSHVGPEAPAPTRRYWFELPQL